jgi:hypothetical protein
VSGNTLNQEGSKVPRLKGIVRLKTKVVQHFHLSRIPTGLLFEKHIPSEAGRGSGILDQMVLDENFDAICC